MSLFQVFANSFIVPISVSIVLTLTENVKSKADQNTVHMPQYAWKLGLGLSVISVCIGIVGWIISIPEWTWIVAVAAGALGLVFLLMYRSLRITYEKTGFCVKRLFRAPKPYHYDEITGVTFGKGEQYTLYLKKGHIFVDNLAVGGTEFLYYAQVKWLECGLGDEFPEKKSRLFNGYLLNPIEFFVSLLIVPVMSTGLLVWFVVASANVRNTIIIAIITLFSWMGFAVVYYICSHAPKFEKILLLLVKREYWNF